MPLSSRKANWFDYFENLQKGFLMHLSRLLPTLAYMIILITHIANATTDTNQGIVHNSDCLTCHQAEHQHWQESDHAKAMAIPSKDNVKGDFNQKRVEHYGQKALFFVENEQYKVTISYDDKVDTYSVNTYQTNTYQVKYTFGHFPLQQYLVETDSGKFKFCHLPGMLV